MVIMFVVRSASKNGTKLNAPVIWVLVLLAIFSFSRAFFPMSYHDSELVAYYLPHLRFGELLIGAILAVAVSNATKEISSTLANVVGSLGLLVLVICRPFLSLTKLRGFQVLLLPFPASLLLQ